MADREVIDAPALGGSVARVVQAAAAAGLPIAVVTLPGSAHTAAAAAAACGCGLGQIVKSLVFEDAGNGGLVLLLVAGDRRVEIAAAGAAAGCDLRRADPRLVRERTGFAIGGVAPLGHLVPLPVFMDPALLAHPVVWAAAGSPSTVFSIAPDRLRAAASARLLPPGATRA